MFEKDLLDIKDLNRTRKISSMSWSICLNKIFYSFNIVRYRTSQKWQVAVERSSENGQTNIASPLPPMRDGPPTWFYNDHSVIPPAVKMPDCNFA